MKDRKQDFLKICDEMANLFAKKNSDYNDDFFVGNYDKLERWMSIRRKIARLKTFYENPERELKVSDETLIDTWKDLANYAVMEIMLLKEKEENEGNNKQT